MNNRWNDFIVFWCHSDFWDEPDEDTNSSRARQISGGWSRSVPDQGFWSATGLRSWWGSGTDKMIRLIKNELLSEKLIRLMFCVLAVLCSVWNFLLKTDYNSALMCAWTLGSEKSFWVWYLKNLWEIVLNLGISSTLHAISWWFP